MMEGVSENLELPGSGGRPLSVRIERPADGPVLAWALFAHCFTDGEGGEPTRRIARALAVHGIGLLCVDMDAPGACIGERASSGFSTLVGDLVAAGDWLRRHHGGPRLLLGHSLGGAAVLAAAGEIPEVSAIATIAAPADPAHVRRQLGDTMGGDMDHGPVSAELDAGPGQIQHEVLDDIERWELTRRVSRLGRALLVFHAPLDRIVVIEHARRLFEAAKHPKSFISLDASDHALSDAADAGYVAAILEAWVSRYVVLQQGQQRGSAAGPRSQGPQAPTRDG